MEFFDASGRASSQALNAALERPSTMSSNFACLGPVLVGVRSMITVTYLSPRRVWRDVFVDADHADSVEAGRVIDQQPLPLGENGVVSGMPGHAQPGGDPRDREVVDDQGFQRPPDPASGELRPLCGRRGGVFAPVASAMVTPVAANPHQQRRGPVTERLMRQRPGDGAPRGRPRSAGPAPRILLGEPALQHRPRGSEPLADHDQAKLLEAGEGRQVGVIEGSVEHVEVFQMVSVRTSIIGRPRRLSRHRRAHPAFRIYPLSCEEP